MRQSGMRPVIGGADGGPPAVAALRDASGTLLCSGTYLGARAVLTAGHCARSDLARVDVAGGSFGVASMVAYPDAASTEDVAVVFLDGDPVGAGSALALGWRRFDVADGAAVDIAGYGTTDASGTLPAAEQLAATTIGDATCARTPGCNVVGGELVAGGDGVDACPGDSGGPLFIGDPFELVGVTSRGIASSAKVCGDGSIFARVDAIADWLGMQTVFASGAGPVAVPSGADWLVMPGDPHDVDHEFAIASSDGEARVKADGTVRICASGDATTVVSVTDATDHARSLRVAIASHDAQQCDFTGFDDGGGCCAAQRGGAPWLAVALVVIGWRRWPMSGRSARRARTTSGSARPTGCAASPPATAPTPPTSSARSRAGTATSRC